MKLICDWCKEPGEIIGDAKSFPGVVTAKCTKCHHEWEHVTRDPLEEFDSFLRDPMLKPGYSARRIKK